MRTVEFEQIRLPGRLLLAVAVGILSTPVSSPSPAGEVYRWVGEDGVVHYSDTRPDHDVPVTTLEIETAPSADYDPIDDPYSILNQAYRIHQIWLDFEDARRARAEERLEAMAYRPTPAPADERYFRYSTYPSYYSPWTAPTPGHRPGSRREQLHALDTLDLLGPRPQSINSGIHQTRAARSQLLPIVPPPAPPPRPQPR